MKQIAKLWRKASSQERAPYVVFKTQPCAVSLNVTPEPHFYCLGFTKGLPLQKPVRARAAGRQLCLCRDPLPLSVRVCRVSRPAVRPGGRRLDTVVLGHVRIIPRQGRRVSSKGAAFGGRASLPVFSHRRLLLYEVQQETAL